MVIYTEKMKRSPGERKINTWELSVSTLTEILVNHKGLKIYVNTL